VFDFPAGYRVFPKYLKLTITAAGLWLVLTSAVSAQTNPNLEQGFKPYGSYVGSDIDSISMTNYNLTLHIPLFEYPQRGALDVKVRIQGNGKQWYVKQSCFTNSCDERWAHSFQAGGGPLTLVVDNGYPTVNYTVVHPTKNLSVPLFTATTPDGATHQLGSIVGGGVAYRAIDGTAIYYGGNWSGNQTASSVVMDRKGANLSATSTNYWQDPNGNFFSTNVDTLQRSIVSGSGTPDITACRSVALPVTSVGLYPFLGPNGSTRLVQECFASINLQTNFNQLSIDLGTPIKEANPTETFLQSVIVYNGVSWQSSPQWTFEYDDRNPGDAATVNYGNVTKITLPTGGTITYTWATGTPCGQGLTPASRAVTSRTFDAHDGTGPQTTTYSGGTIDPAGNFTNYQVSALGFSCSYYVTAVKYYQGMSTLLKTVTTDYSYTPNPLDAYGDGTPTVVNVMPIRVTTTWPISGSSNTLVSKVETDYDTGFTFFGNGQNTVSTLGLPTERREYDYGTNAPGPLIRRTDFTYSALTNSNYLAANNLDLVTQQTVRDGSGNIVSDTKYLYDGSTLQPSGITTQHQAPLYPSYRGNQTSVQNWLNTTNSWITSKSVKYFDTGMPYQVTDALGNVTTYTYDPAYVGAYLTQTQSPDTGSPAVHHITSGTYDFNTGLIASSTDQNGLVTGYSYDVIGRMSGATFPNNGSETWTYTDTVPVTITKTQKINASQSKVTSSIFDGLGRVIQAQLTSDPQGTVFTDTTYDNVGRVHTVSNPYRAGTDATTTTGLTTYAYDGMGRKISETEPDNSVLQTAYCGPNTLVTDPTTKWRRSRTDGLGRLVEVDEPNAVGATVATTGCPGTSEPIWVTSYTNDTLGNLTNVLQNGSHARTFTYDSLSRLLTSNNPETGTITYTYNLDSTVATKKDARLITTTYSYDAVHRTTGLTYSNSDPALAFHYDEAPCLGLTACQNIGHRTSMTDGAGSEAWAYQTDPANLRSVHTEQRTTISSPSNITKSTNYFLDLAGNVTQMVYPTGRIVNYTYDSADRPKSASDSANGITYATGKKTPPTGTNCIATGVCYTPQGSEYAVSLGQTTSFNGLNITETYNSRLQPSEIRASSSVGNAMDITYNFVDPATSFNAGHVYGITNNLNTKRSQVFTYDQLNRITSAGTTDTTTVATCWGNKYTYDAWANLLSQAAWTPTYNACTESTMGGVTADGNNHISGLAYDTSGNTLTDGNNTYTWNGESQMKTAGGVTYAYDGDGRRAAKVGSKLYWYGSGGEILAETNAAGATLNEYVFFGGRRVALVPATGTALYYAEDFLGSSRVMVQSTGTLCYDADFTPFGAERTITNTCTQNAYKFEGKERDAETGNDDFGAREYSWRMGRWLSSDWSAVPVAVPYANLTNPQTLNLYSMVADDPESFADLDGHADAATIWTFVEIAVPVIAPELMIPIAGATLVSTAVAAGADVRPPAYVPGGSLTDEKGNSVFSSQHRDSLKQTAPKATQPQGGQQGQASPGNKGTSDGPRAGKPMTPKGKREVKAENAARHGGQTTCEKCGRPTVPAEQSKSGVTPPGDETHVDHIDPQSKNGDGSPSNGQILCRDCNLEKSNKPQ
jgi:RHS repeat-associated protein